MPTYSSKKAIRGQDSSIGTHGQTNHDRNIEDDKVAKTATELSMLSPEFLTRIPEFQGDEATSEVKDVPNSFPRKTLLLPDFLHASLAVFAAGFVGKQRIQLAYRHFRHISEHMSIDHRCFNILVA